MNIRKRKCTTSLPYLWNCPLTSGNNDRLGVPEWNLPERIKFTDGDEIWEVFNDGTQRLRGVYNEDLGKFISK